MCDTRPFLEGRSSGESVTEIDGAACPSRPSAKNRRRGHVQSLGIRAPAPESAPAGRAGRGKHSGRRHSWGRHSGGRKGGRGRFVHPARPEKSGSLRVLGSFGLAGNSGKQCGASVRGGHQIRRHSQGSSPQPDQPRGVAMHGTAQSSLRPPCVIRTGSQRLLGRKSEESCGLWVRLVFRPGSESGARASDRAVAAHEMYLSTGMISSPARACEDQSPEVWVPAPKKGSEPLASTAR
jgi:hypothetical protein